MWTICRKELADHFTSSRFLILFCLVLMVALVSTYMAATNLRERLKGCRNPRRCSCCCSPRRGNSSPWCSSSLLWTVARIIMGFDAINRRAAPPHAG